MIGSDNRRSERARPPALSVSALVIVIVGSITFLVLVATLTSRAASDALRHGDIATSFATSGPTSARSHAGSLARLASGPKLNAAAARRASTGGVKRKATGLGHADPTPAPVATKASAAAAGSAPVGRSPTPPTPTGATSPATRSGMPPANTYVAPTVVGTAVKRCTVDPGGSGVVTYTVAFQGGTGWSPGANFKDGAYTLKVRGGRGANSGLDAVINGAPVFDTADGVQAYVPFPASLVVEARC